MNQKVISVPQRKRNNTRRSNASDGTVSSHSSSNWSLEQAKDDPLNCNSCTDSVPPSSREHTDNPVQLVESAQSNANNISPDIQIVESAFIKNYRCTSEPLAAVDVNRELGGYGAEVISKLENGRNMSGIRNYGVQLEKKLRVHQHCKENYFHDDSLDSGENFDSILGLQNTQIRNYSGVNYRPHGRVYPNGAAHTEMLLSDCIRTSEHVLNTKMPMRERAAPIEFSYGQTLETFNRLNLGRAIRGSAIGLNTVPMTSSFKTELASTGNQNFSPKEYVRYSKLVENSASLNGKAGTNMWVGGNQNLSFGKCMPSMRCVPAADDNSPKTGDLNSWGGEYNNAVRPEFVPTSNSDSVLFVNIIKTGNSVSSLGGNQEMLPTSEDTRGVGIKSPSYASGTFCKNVDIDIKSHSRLFNPAPGGPVYIHERNNIVGQREEMLHAASPFWNLF
jgi:hypothetical protein